MMILVILSAVLCLHSAYANNQSIIIGTGYFLPSYDLLGDDLVGGYIVYKNLTESDCVQKVASPKLDDNTDFIRDTESFYTSISTETKVSVELKSDVTMGVTLDVTTRSISGSNRTVTGVTYHTYSIQDSEYIKANCETGDLADDVVQRFEGLNPVIQAPYSASNWSAYDAFLRQIGSHVVVKVHYGSSLYQYTFSNSDSHYTEEQLTVKACADITGPTAAGLLNVSACSGVTKEQIHNVSRITTSSRLVARGGTDATRTQLHSNRSDELIQQFLLEASTTHQPIKYALSPIWIIMKNRYVGTEHYAKALNLEAYYKGYLNYGCRHSVDGWIQLQRFDTTSLSTADYPIYQCTIAPGGCHDYNRDCQYHAAFRCYCSGPSCVKVTTSTLNTGGTKYHAAIYNVNRGQDLYGYGCHNVIGLRCKCKTPSNVRRVVWSLSSDYSQFSYLAHDKGRLSRSTSFSGQRQEL